MRWRRKQQDFNAELEAHLQLEADQLRSEGLPTQEAQAAARRALGNRTSAEERFYESSRWMLAQHFFRDLRFAGRVLMKDAKFSVLAILGLALGIGVSTGIFAVVDAVVRPQFFQEVRNPETYVGLDRREIGWTFSYLEYRYFQEHSTTFGEISAESPAYNLVLGSIAEAADAEEVFARFESENFLSVLHLQPALGRSFSEADEQPGAPPVAVLSYRFWQRRFAGNANAIGKTIVLNSHPVTIVGIADSQFRENDSSVVFLPLDFQRLVLDLGDWSHDPDATWLVLHARLRPGVSLSQAQAEANVLGDAFADSNHPGAAERGDGRVPLSAGGVNPKLQRRPKQYRAASISSWP